VWSASCRRAVGLCFFGVAGKAACNHPCLPYDVAFPFSHGAFLAMNPSTTLLVYCCVIVIASTVGGALPTLVRLTHRRIQMTLSLVSGVMLGVALMHLLPHSIYVLQSPEKALLTCLFGLLFMFFMVRMFHFHQHDLAVDTAHDHAHKHLCEEERDHHHVHCDQHGGNIDLTWAGLCFGLAVHTIADGIALAAAVGSRSELTLAGLGVFLAIVLHSRLSLALFSP
jgi:zinc and cadmium transporter